MKHALLILLCTSPYIFSMDGKASHNSLVQAYVLSRRKPTIKSYHSLSYIIDQNTYTEKLESERKGSVEPTHAKRSKL